MKDINEMKETVAAEAQQAESPEVTAAALDAEQESPEAPAAESPATESPSTAAPAPAKGGAGKKILAVVAGLMLLLSTASSVMFLMDKFGGGEDGEFGPTREDGVVIADEYTIESTLPISDAYKSGDTDKLDDRQKQVLDAASKVIDEVITDGMSDYEKEKAIYEWIVKNVPFDNGMTTLINKSQAQPECDGQPSGESETETTVTTDGDVNGDADAGTPYGALIKHRAVCAGYATTFRMFMQMLDIECMVVHSTDLIHSWDLVKIDDHWYHVDIYSDVDSALYGNFNLNDEMMMQDWDREFFPAADSLAANPAYKERVTCKSVYDIPAAIRSALNDHKGALIIEFTEAPSAEDQQLAIFMVSAISMDLSYDNALRASVYDGRWINADGETTPRLFTLDIMYSDDDTDTSAQAADLLDETTRDKATKALQDAFGDLSEYIRIEDGVY
ncbi:MAG: hypothetical protein K6B12_03810 [Clostridiales bacterium]|nr:hypothetical protein [Clostridiales bacterium]